MDQREQSVQALTPSPHSSQSVRRPLGPVGLFLVCDGGAVSLPVCPRVPSFAVSPTAPSLLLSNIVSALDTTDEGEVKTLSPGVRNLNNRDC